MMRARLIGTTALACALLIVASCASGGAQRAVLQVPASQPAATSQPAASGSQTTKAVAQTAQVAIDSDVQTPISYRSEFSIGVALCALVLIVFKELRDIIRDLYDYRLDCKRIGPGPKDPVA